MAKEYKICNDKDCEHKGQPQPIKMFGIRNTEKDGFNPKCKACVSRRQKEYMAAKKAETKPKTASKIVKQNEGKTWDTSEHPKDEGLARKLRPLYSYLINADVRDGIVWMNKSVGDLLLFFDVPQRATMEAILSFMKRNDKGQYQWETKPKDFTEFMNRVIELVPNGKLKTEPHNLIIYEAMEKFSERLLGLENKIQILIDSLIGEQKDG